MTAIRGPRLVANTVDAEWAAGVAEREGVPLQLSDYVPEGLAYIDDPADHEDFRS